MAGPMLMLLAMLSTLAAEPPADVRDPPPYADFLVIPLRVHILSATDLPEVDCGLKDADITRIVGKVNGIWHVAGIHFGLESILHEAADRQERFRLLREVAGDAPLDSFKILAPAASREFAGEHVYYVHKLPVNGVHFGSGISFVQETAKLRKVEGGIDEPLPRVTAHELGHGLALVHRQAETNLLASGTTGTLLNEDEVKQARAGAKMIPGELAFADLRAAADKESDPAIALRLWTWLADIPGDGAEEARRHLAK